MSSERERDRNVISIYLRGVCAVRERDRNVISRERELSFSVMLLQANKIDKELNSLSLFLSLSHSLSFSRSLALSPSLPPFISPPSFPPSLSRSLNTHR